MNTWLAVGVLLAAGALGAWGGKAWEHRKVEALVAEAQKDALAEAARVNAANVELSKLLSAKIDENHGLEDQLRESLARVPEAAKTRTIYREIERASNPDCRAWLDSVVPCRLQPVPADNGH